MQVIVCDFDEGIIPGVIGDDASLLRKANHFKRACVNIRLLNRIFKAQRRTLTATNILRRLTVGQCQLWAAIGGINTHNIIKINVKGERRTRLVIAIIHNVSDSPCILNKTHNGQLRRCRINLHIVRCRQIIRSANCTVNAVARHIKCTRTIQIKRRNAKICRICLRIRDNIFKQQTLAARTRDITRTPTIGELQNRATRTKIKINNFTQMRADINNILQHIRRTINRTKTRNNRRRRINNNTLSQTIAIVRSNINNRTVARLIQKERVILKKTQYL